MVTNPSVVPHFLGRKLRVVCVALVVVGALGSTSNAWAGTTQDTVMGDSEAFGTTIQGDPYQNMVTAKNLGADNIREVINWNKVAPGSSSCAPPSEQVQSDPATYDFSRLNIIAGNASQLGLRLYIAFDGPFPCWASLDPRGDPTGTCTSQPTQCRYRPDPAAYARFVRVVADKFRTVNRWSPWNEPNSLGGYPPQPKTGVSDPESQQALMYRHLWFVAESEIRRYSSAPLWVGDVTGKPAHDYGGDGDIDVKKFLYTALCASGHRAGSEDAAYNSCGSAPAAMQAEGIAFHPYTPNQSGRGTDGLPQRRVEYLNAYSSYRNDLTSQGVIRHSSGPYILNSEFGYRSDPPDSTYGVDYATHSAYRDCTEHADWENGANALTSQYLLYDDEPSPGGFFPTGLLRSGGAWKNAYLDFGMPFDVYRSSTGALLVWGGVRETPVPGGYIWLGGKNSSGDVVYSRQITPNSRGYFKVSLSDAPGGLVWYITTADFLRRSRTASGSDCGSGWRFGT